MELIERMDFLFAAGAEFMHSRQPGIAVETWNEFLVVFAIVLVMVSSTNMLALIRPFFRAVLIYPIFSLNFPGGALTHGFMIGFVIAWLAVILPIKPMTTEQIVVLFIVIPLLLVGSLLMSKRNIRLTNEGWNARSGEAGEAAKAPSNEAIPADKKFDKATLFEKGFTAEQIAAIKQDEKDGWFEI